MIHHHHPRGLLDALAYTVTTYVDELAKRGLDLNLGPGKTEALVLLRGPTSRTISREVFGRPDPSIVADTQAKGRIEVRLVTQYKHLGFQIHANGKLTSELRTRIGAAHTAFTAHGRNVYYNRGLSLPHRVQIFKSCVLSVLFWNSGTWPALSDSELRQFNGAYKRLVRRLLVKDFDMETLCQWTDLRLFAHVGVLPAGDLIRLERLRYFGRLIRQGPNALWALIVGEQKWFSQIQPDFAWLWKNVQSKVFRPDPCSDEGVHYWTHLIQTQDRTWKGLLKKAAKHALIQLCTKSEVCDFHADFLRVLEAHDPRLTPRQDLADLSQDLHVCLLCRRAFATKTAWATHNFRAHGRRAPARYLADTSTCEHCMHSFLSPHRLYLHLRHSEECFAALRLRGVSVAPLPGRGSRIWRTTPQFTLCPYLIAEGPSFQLNTIDGVPLPALAPHEVDLLTTLSDLETMDVDWSSHDPVQTQTWPAIQTGLCAHPTSLTEMATVLQVWKAMIQTDLQPLRRLIPAQPGLWLRSIDYAMTQLDYAILAPDLAHHAQVACPFNEPEARVASIPAEVLCEVPAPTYGPKTEQPVYIHLYSGRRRDGDFQAELERLDWGTAWKPIVISLDIVISETSGNVFDPKVRKQWLTAIRSGLITGLLMGPPCETWSVSRERWLQDHSGPRPLRSSTSLWGFDSLLIKEARQIYTANALLLFGIAAFFFMWCQGRMAIKEHPGMPSERHRPTAPSIWKLPAIRLLIGLPGTALQTIYQGLYGAKSPKPTGLLTCHSPELDSDGRRFHVRETLPPILRMGRHNGAYATYELKEYPQALNAHFAAAFRQTWISYPDCPDPLSIPSSLRLLFDEMTSEIGQGNIGPDYAFN
eukprot:Skav228087  [mRNA]  locus=scaffold913:403566:406172:+ [translate_table: standard]